MGEAILARSIGGLNTIMLGRVEVFKTEIFTKNSIFNIPVLLKKK